MIYDKRKLLYLLVFFQAALILALVPAARTLERLGGSFISTFPLVIRVGAGALCLLILFVLFRYFIKVRQFLTTAQFRIHTVLLAVCFTAALMQVHLPIEFAHIVLYGLFAGLLQVATASREKPLSPLWIILIGLALGVTDELLQWVHPERVFDVRDITLNLTATCFGLAVVYPLTTKATTDRKPPLSSCSNPV